MKEITERPLQAAIETLTPALHGKDEKARLVAAKCIGLMHGYDHRWRQAPYWIDSVESVESAALWNPETGKSSRSFTVAGKLDIKAREEKTDARVLFDHKSTSEDIADPNSAYWRQLVVEGQPTHYMLLEWCNGIKVDYGLWDVMKKPQISPRQIAKADAARLLAGASYFDYTLAEEDRQYVSEFGRENLSLYIARLVDDVTVQRPERHFQRRMIPRLDAEVLEYATELWGHGQDILATRRANRWPRNSGACFTYNRPCKFLPLCSKSDTLDSGKWGTKHWVHPELPQGLPNLPEGRGLDILTNSRIRCFQTCRQKHFLTYELGVDKVDEEEQEALYFGNLWHTASEQYFLNLKEQQA